MTNSSRHSVVCKNRASAQVQMVSQAKGLKLTDFELFQSDWTATDLEQPPIEVVKAIGETRLKMDCVDKYIERLKTDREFQRRIGGIKWTLNVKSLVVVTLSTHFEYLYRSLPCSIQPDDKLWFVAGTDHVKGQSGILEWCYDAYDAAEIQEAMLKDTGRFEYLHVAPFGPPGERA